MAITKVTSRVLEDSSVGVAQLSSLAVPTKLTSEIGALNFRNKIINGNFDFWQRGTSLTSGTGTRYLADRFACFSIGSTYTASQQLFAIGQTEVPNNPNYFHRIVVTSVAGSLNTCSLVQRIESIKSLAQKIVTISFYAKADSNKPMIVSFTQWFGTGGSPSSRIDGIGCQKLNLTTSWQKFTVTANIPSIQNKTLGTNNDDFLQLNFGFDAGSDYNSITNNLGQQSGTFDIAQVQLEEGPVATPFEQRPIGLELSLCQRYYEKSTHYEYPLFPAPGATYAGNYPVTYKATKRTGPTVTITSTSDFNIMSKQIASDANDLNKFVYYIQAAGAGAVYNTFVWVANAEL